MGILNWIYGGVIIFLALDAWFLHFLPSQFSPVAVGIMGVLILFTSMGQFPTASQNIRRFVFGIALVLLGGGSLLSIWYENFPLFTTFSLPGQLILILIGIIYFFGGTRRGAMNLSTV